jgi:hypothetical protein
MKFVGPFLGAAVGTMLLLQATDSAASNWKREWCTVPQVMGDPGLQTAAGNAFICAWQDESDSLQAANITSVLANFYAPQQVGLNQLNAKTCIQYWNAMGGACGVNATNNSILPAGSYTLNVDFSEWADANRAHPHFFAIAVGSQYKFVNLYAAYP